MDYLTYMWANISVDLAHHEIVRAHVGKGGIKSNTLRRKFILTM